MNRGDSPNDFITGTLVNSIVNLTKEPTGFYEPPLITAVKYDPIKRTVKLEGEVRVNKPVTVANAGVSIVS